jgi:DNA-binding LacI/PurR family transcriptional regulator
MPTLVDVAREAGVSRGTASNVFAHPDRVRPAVRERVAAAAARLGYAGPDPRGRLLRAGRFNALGYVVPGAYGIVQMIESPYGRELLFGISEVCDEAGMALTLIDGRRALLGSALRDALVDGFILGHTGDLAAIEPARQRRLPFVILDSDAGPDVNSISIDGTGGAREAARHLIGLGHRHFAIVAVRRTPGPAIVHPPGRNRRLADGFPLDDEKLRGYAEALAEAGVSIDDMPIIEAVPWDKAAGAAVLAAAPEATAILVMADRQAIVILEDFARRGVRVPEDISVVGFDGVPEAAHTTPPLTTIVQPIREKTRLAARMVIESGAPQQFVLPVELAIRGSTAPPPA